MGGRQAPSLGVHLYSGETLADSVDWVEKGAVTPVKDQSQCGSCWAFSTTGGLEGAWQVATGKLASLSEEQLVDCDKGGNGCHGGLMDQGFEFLQTVDVCSEQSYPYTAGSGHEGSCKSQCDVAIPKGSVTGHMDVDHSEEALMSALMKGPVSIAIEADQSSFQHYTSGVLTAACGSQLDHGVLAVGYGEEDGTKYWKVKNSWGSSWGDAGYIRIERGAGGSGECGILQAASYPVVSATAALAAERPEPYKAAWEDFKSNFAREYGAEEEMIRQAIFVANMKHIEAENAKGHRYKLGVNQFTDMTPEEYKQRLGFKPSGRQAPSLGVHLYSGETLADSVDWVEK